MAVISWKECYETKIASMDEEHQRLVALINQLYTAIREKRSTEVMATIFAELLDYTRQHFQHEEQLLEENSYPELESHQELHQELTQKVLAYRERLEQGEDLSAMEVMKFLRSWLLQHIVENDLPYGQYLQKQTEGQ